MGGQNRNALWGCGVIASAGVKPLGSKFGSTDRSMVLCPAVGGKSVELFLACPPGGVLQTFSAAGQSSIMFAGKDSFGRSQDLKLATAHVKAGKLVWEEKKVPSTIRRARSFSKIRQTLRLTRLQVSDSSKSLFACQFIPVVKLDLKLTNRLASASIPCSYEVCKPVMKLSADSNWTSEASERL